MRALLFLLGLWTAAAAAAADFDHRVRDALGGHGRRTHVDEALLYVPAAAIYGLDLCGVEARHGAVQQTETLVLGFVYTQAMAQGLKHAVGRRRPDGADTRSFPSGHTATAFMGAEVLRMEFGGRTPWIPVAGYATATATAVLRIANDRHWATDTMAGAAVGVLGAHLAAWSQPAVDRWLFGDGHRRGLFGRRGEKEHAVVAPFYNSASQAGGIALVWTF